MTSYYALYEAPLHVARSTREAKVRRWAKNALRKLNDRTVEARQRDEEREARQEV